MDVVVSDFHLQLAKIAANDRGIPVVLLGETGTGKEEMAKLIHSLRCETEGRIPLVVVNCANLSEDLLESTLFGHKRGSFSGAHENATGYVGDANGGILFLDEIHTLSRKCQSKLLRVMNDGTYQRVGDSTVLRSRFQPIVATTRDLDMAVESGNFLIDLRMRLIGLDFLLPPLRERFGDLPDLIRVFLSRRKAPLRECLVQTLCQKCREYYWRGNIRQLFMILNVFFSTQDISHGGMDLRRFPEFPSMFAPQGGWEVAEKEPAYPTGAQIGRSVMERLSELLKSDLPMNDSLEYFERELLRSGLERHGFNVAQLCRKMKIPRSTFELKKRKYGFHLVEKVSRK